MLKNTTKLEFTILVSMMPDDELCNYAIAELQQDCFTTEQAKICFSSIKELQAMGRQATLDNVNIPIDIYSQIMQDEGLLEIDEFKKSVDELLRWRTCKQIMALADMVKSIASTGNIDKSMNYLFDNISKVKKDDNKRLSVKTFKQAAQFAKDRINKIREGGINSFFIPSGYAEIDRVYNGFPTSALGIVGAASGVGKSTFILPVLIANADKPIFIASTEVTPAGMAANISAAKSKLFRSDITRGRLSDEDFEKYIATLDNFIANMNGEITMQRKLSRIVSEIKIWRAKTNVEEPAVCVVDFINDVTDDHGMVYRYESNLPTAISILKGIAMELNLTVFVLSQFNRSQLTSKDAKDNNFRPEGSFIIGSGSGFQSADFVILPHRPVMYLKGPEKDLYEGLRYEDAILIIEKYKDTKPMDIPVIFDAFVTNFINVEMRETNFANGKRLMPMLASNLNEEFFKTQKRK